LAGIPKSLSGHDESYGSSVDGDGNTTPELLTEEDLMMQV